MKYNMDIKKRDEFLFGNYDPHRYDLGGISRFRYLYVEGLKWLVDEGFADPDEAQNDAPTIEEFINFMENHPEFVAHGYAVTDERDDYRISIEGIESDDEIVDVDTLKDFVDMFRFADEFYIDPPYCWFD